MPRYSLRQVLTRGECALCCLGAGPTRVRFELCLSRGISCRAALPGCCSHLCCIAYGAILGIIGGFLVMMLFIRFRLGYSTPSNYQESFAIEGILQAWRSYVVHLVHMGAHFWHCGFGAGKVTQGNEGARE